MLLQRFARGGRWDDVVEASIALCETFNVEVSQSVCPFLHALSARSLARTANLLPHECIMYYYYPLLLLLRLTLVPPPLPPLAPPGAAPAARRAASAPSAATGSGCGR